MSLLGSALAQTEETERDIRIVYITHEEPGNPFFVPVENGIKAAAADLGVTVEYHATEFSAGTMAMLIDEAVATEADGIVVSIFDVDRLGPRIIAAVDAGIPVIAVNQGFDTALELGALAYVGEDSYAVGFSGGERMAAAGASHALCLNPAPGISVLELRCEGFSDALAEAGATVEVLAINLTSAAAAVDRISEALSANPDVDAILSQGANPTSVALQALDESGLMGEVLLATFDLSTEILEAIRDGDMLFAIDQQPYLQGYLPIMYLTLYIENLNTPGNPIIQTSPGFITAENVDEVMALVAAGTR